MVYRSYIYRSGGGDPLTSPKCDDYGCLIWSNKRRIKRIISHDILRIHLAAWHLRYNMPKFPSVLKRDLLNPAGQSLNPVVGQKASILAKPSNIRPITQREVTNKGKIRFQGLRRVYEVPSWSRLVPKGTAPKGAPTLILPILTTNPNRVVVEIDVFVYATGFSNCPTGFNNSHYKLHDFKQEARVVPSIQEPGFLTSCRKIVRLPLCMVVVRAVVHTTHFVMPCAMLWTCCELSQ